MSKLALILTTMMTLPMALLASTSSFAAVAHGHAELKRTEIKVSEGIRMKMRQPSDLMNMVTLTPIVDENDDVTCVQISEIRDPMVTNVLKARVGDCLTEVSIYRMERNGLVKEVYPVLSATDALLLYKDINGASKIEINLQRNKQTIPMTYVVN